MFRLTTDTGGDSGSLGINVGITIIDASDTSKDLALFLDMIANPNLYKGRLIYITAIGPTVRPDPFFFAQKFYFNEDGSWFESPFSFNGI